MITIEIKGPRGQGKTTTTIAIARLLRDFKQEVKVQCHRGSKKAVDQFMQEPLSIQAKNFSAKHKFLIVDIHDSGSSDQK